MKQVEESTSAAPSSPNARGATVAIMAIVSLAVSLLILLPMCSGEENEAILDHFPRNDSDAVLTAKVTARWETDSDPSVIAPNPEHIEVLLDLSIPMGGYMPTSPDSMSLLPDIFRNLANKLQVEYGDTGVPLQCLGISSQITPFECASVLKRELFDGNGSQLTVAIRQALQKLKDGRIEMMVLISDLLATAENAGGIDGSAANLLPVVQDPVLLAHYNAGTAHMALMGIRLSYWGVSRGPCADPSQHIGCWFQEGQRQYSPLSKPRVRRPLYLLFVSRGQDPGAYSVMSSLEEALFDIMPGDMDLRTDTLTHGSTGIDASSRWDEISWDSSDDKYNVTFDSDGDMYICANRAGDPLRFKVFGNLEGRGLPPLGDFSLAPESGTTERWLTAGDAPQPGRVFAEVDCNAICRREPKESPIQGVLALRARGSQSGWGNPWSSSAEVEDRTFGLDDLIQGLRPDYYGVKVSPFGTFQCSD